VLETFNFAIAVVVTEKIKIIYSSNVFIGGRGVLQESGARLVDTASTASVS
jgi:hypothetical protein